MLENKITLTLMRNAYKFLVASLCIRLDRHIRGCEVVNRIRLAQNLLEWQVLVNRVMNLNITHKAEIYGDVSGGKWQINALAAQRLGVLNEAISVRLLLTARIFGTLYLRKCLCTQIYILMECSLKNLREIFTFRAPVGFPSDDAV